ncbi:MAG: hypothetical protein ACOC2P_00865 [Spirochaetota bacterium]
MEHREWYRLDNTANLYPSVINRKNTTLFRISVHLNQAVHADRLNRTLQKVVPRFPYYQVHVRRGAFWYTLEENPRIPNAVIDSKSPCRYMPIKQRGIFPFRIRAFDRTLAIEISHALTDGTGALRFMKSLLAAYRLVDLPSSSAEYKKLYSEFQSDTEILLFDEQASPEEFEDAFLTHYDPTIPAPDQEKKVFHLPGKKLPVGRYRIITGDMPVQDLKLLAKSYGGSLTEFLVAVYFYSLQHIQEIVMSHKVRGRWDPLSVMVPVNLRPILHSSTMRNFFLTLNPMLDTRLGHYELDEITQKVHHFMRTQLDHRHLKQQISRNVKGALHPLLRISPLWMKNIGLKMIYRDFGESRFSGSLSNLGRVEFSPALDEIIEAVEFIPPPSSALGVKCGALSHHGRLRLTFGSLLQETALERLFFTTIRSLGIPVSLSGNWKGEE